MERVTGIEPAFSAWEADVLPLNYTRVGDRGRSAPQRYRRYTRLKNRPDLDDDVRMTRSVGRLAVALVLLLAGLRWIVNSNPWSGPVVMSLSPTHGVHTNDWLTFALWTVSLLLACPAWVSSAATLVPLPASGRRPG